MEVQRLPGPAAFLEVAADFLIADEARHNLLFGIVDTLANLPAAYPVHHLWVARDGERTVGAAVQTPPHNLVVARPTVTGALEAIADAIIAGGTAIPGVTGAAPEVDDFARAWVSRIGCSSRARMAQGIFALRAVRDVPRPPGSSRSAAPSDLEDALGLFEAFQAEAVPHAPQDPARDRLMLEARLGNDARTGLWFWEDRGRIVSLSGYQEGTPNGARIGPVYTPPEDRRRGYATALVAAQSAWLLARGRRFCFLYTDLANPTSNAIYRRIGYEQACESSEIVFEL